jgi:uncharacterized membrane protein YphA (DoxX/SURF4 family)
MFVALSVLLVAVCLIPAVGKLRSHPKMLASANHFGIAWPRYRLVGFAELAAAGGVVIGLFVPGLGIAAAAGMAVLLIGALTTHHRAGDAPKDAAPAAVALLVTVGYLGVALAR